MTAPDLTKTQASPANPAAGGSVAAGQAMPQVAKEAAQLQRKRIPMSVPTRRLETTPIEGFYQHWIKSENLPQAYAAHYVHVKDDEVQINSRNVSLDSPVGGTADLSDRVCVQYGGDTLWLMKLPEDLHNEDMAGIAARNQLILNQIFRGEQVAGQAQPNPGDPSQAYVKQDLTNMKGQDLRSNKPLFARTYKEKR